MRENMKRASKNPTSGKHVLSFALLGVLLAGATFVLGVSTGRRMAQAQTMACENNPLMESDRKTEALAQIQQREQPPFLTFQEELLKPMPVAVATPALVPATAPLPKPVKENVEPSVQAPTPAVAQQGSLKKAFLEFEKEGKEVSKKEVLKPAVAVKESAAVLGEWTLQVSSHKVQEDAERMAAKLNDKGYVAYVLATELGERGTWHRVRVGQFSSKEEAETLAHKLVEDMRMSAPLVVSLK